MTQPTRAPNASHGPLHIDRDEPYWSIILKGFCMGSADVVPGVSGGTVAFITGIYARLIGAVKSFDLTLARLVLKGDLRGAFAHVDIVFLLPLAIGIVGALATFTRVIPLPELVTTRPQLVYSIFFGLILGSCWTLLVQLPHRGGLGWLALIGGAALAFPIITAVPASTPDGAWFLALAGTFALSAMILPGISGSFVLLILGKYATVLDAVGHLNFAVLIPFLAGGAVGFLSFARLLSWLIHRYAVLTTHTIIGVLLASLYVIWPFQAREYATVHGKEKLIASVPMAPESVGDGLTALALAAVAAGLVIVLERVARRG